MLNLTACSPSDVPSILHTRVTTHQYDLSPHYTPGFIPSLGCEGDRLPMTGIYILIIDLLMHVASKECRSRFAQGFSNFFSPSSFRKLNTKSHIFNLRSLYP